MSIKVLIKVLYLRVIYSLRNKNKKSVFFNSFNGQYSDNPRAISEAIHSLNSSIELVWYLNDDVEAPSYIIRTSDRIKAKKLQVCADAWVMNNNSVPDLGDYKGKNTFFVMTWHGDRGFKKIGWATENQKKDAFDGRYFDMRDVNLFTSASECGELVANEGLHYHGEIQKAGSPRNDKLVNIDDNLDYATSIRKKLNINKDYKVLLFAPTFRDNQQTLQNIDIDIEQVLSRLESKGEKWVCLIRAHSSSKGFKIGKDDRFVDVTKYGDMADLLLITDCLITDYSSCSCDYILTGRPCVLAQFDRLEYVKSSREFWYNPDETGFIVAKNQEELNTIIETLDSYDHKKIDSNILDFYGTYETGKASILTANRIIEWINTNHKN